MWTKRTKFGEWGDLPIAQVRTRLRSALVEIVSNDLRVHDEDMTEYTLQAIIYEHASWALGPRWRVLVEDFVHKTDMKADLVIDRLCADGSPDKSTGTIAIEVKPKGGVETLGPDIEKLKSYVRRSSNAVNCGILFYLSARETDRNELRRMIGTLDQKVSVAWIKKER
jgi:hypothetical protein